MNGLSDNTKFSTIWLVKDAITVIASFGLIPSVIKALNIFIAVSESAGLKFSLIAAL